MGGAGTGHGGQPDVQPPSALIAAPFTSVANGDAIFGAGIAQRILRLLSGETAPIPVPFPQLTDREREILAHLADGATNHQIAAALHLSPRTVANHVSNILSKLHATDRTAAALRARDAGLGHPPTEPR